MRSTVSNHIDEQKIRNQMLELRRSGWKVKFVCDQSGLGDKTLMRFRANRNHINLRGSKHIGKYIGDWKTGFMLTGWVFEIYIRNANGGYNKKSTVIDLADAIKEAVKLSNGEPPEIPVWHKAKMPDAFPLSEKSNVYYTSRVRHEEFSVIIETLVYAVHCMGIVSIADDCTVSMDATMVPDNKAWVLLECSGTEGRFLIISDGDYFYPVKRMRGSGHNEGGKHVYNYKLSLDLTVNNANLRNLNRSDSMAIRLAIKKFMNWYAEEMSK